MCSHGGCEGWSRAMVSFTEATGEVAMMNAGGRREKVSTISEGKREKAKGRRLVPWEKEEGQHHRRRVLLGP